MGRFRLVLGAAPGMLVWVVLVLLWNVGIDAFDPSVQKISCQYWRQTPKNTQPPRQLCGACPPLLRFLGPQSLQARKKMLGLFSKEEQQDNISSSSSVAKPKDEAPFSFIRPSFPGDMGRASQILTDGFFSRKTTNWWTYQWERFETYLSLESTFPKPFTRHVIFVACESQSGQVLGLAELDARVHKARGRDTQTNKEITTGPYMCNLAVDEQYWRKGIAKSLIRTCESQVQKWYQEDTAEDENSLLTASRMMKPKKDNKKKKKKKERMSCSLYLKVRSNNEAAIRMYSNLDYQTILQETDPKTKQPIYVMRKELDRPITATSSTLDTEDRTSVLSTSEYEQ